MIKGGLCLLYFYTLAKNDSNKVKRYSLLITVLCIFLCNSSSWAQETDIYTNTFKNYKLGLELFEKEKYSAARNAFKQTQKEIGDPSSSIFEDAVYFEALCAINLFHRDAEHSMRSFIQNYPESPKNTLAWFHLGLYEYRKKNWKETVNSFKQIDPYNLSLIHRYEYYFKKGYAFFQLNQLDEAKRNLYELLDIESPYHAAANYYYAHAAYEQGQHETAMRYFRKIEKDEKFGGIVPYYISQIFYFQQKHDSLLTYAKPMLEREETKRKAEIARLVGEAYFTKKEYNKALPFLEQYYKEADNKTREDDFQLGLCYFYAKDFENAVKYLHKTTYTNDQMAQEASIVMAQAYIQLGDKKAARNSYLTASNLNGSPQMAEEAYFNFAKLSYELSLDPYNQTIDAFISYLEKYPKGTKKEEAFDYLINIYLASKNYRTAIGSLESTKKLDPRLQEVYQKLLFNLGVEQFLNGQFAEAQKSFEKSIEGATLPELAAQAHYWKAESAYQRKMYRQAVIDYEKFIFAPRAILLPEFNLANYSLGYAHFQLKEYESASIAFRKYLASNTSDSTRIHDAFVRIGDCFFIRKEYLLAIDFYEKAIQMTGQNQVDYALYQYAMASGLLGNTEQKLTSLKRFETEFAKSEFTDATLYELGRIYLSKNENAKAISYFEKVSSNYPNSPYKRRSDISLAQIYYNKGQNDKALVLFKKVIEENPTYQASREAIRGIENIYKEDGRIDLYEEYVKSLGFMNISNGSLDSLTYEAAELPYIANNCESASKAFKAYLLKFDAPIFYLNANFYLAECLLKAGSTEEALEYYTNIINQPSNNFSESALDRSSAIVFAQGNYSEAARQYKELGRIAQFPETKRKAIVGEMRSLYLNNQINEASTLAKEVEKLEVEKSVLVLALYIQARAMHLNKDWNNAIRAYRIVTDTTQSERSAEAEYRIAEILYNLQIADSAENQVFKLINHTPTYDKWLAKGLMLLSDIYILKNDDFQAKATLESVIENFKGDESILKQAEEKLEALKQKNEKQAAPESKPIEINMGLDEDEYESMFENEIDLEDNF